MIANFNQFINESLERKGKKTAAGVALLFDNKILLIHPTNSGWQRSTCGIPKGGIEEGEEPFDAALRELYEETGISIEPSLVDPTPHTVDFYRGTTPVKKMIYFVCEISDLSEIGLTDLKLPDSMLQQHEVDWAKFVGREEAYGIISRSQMIILDRHLINK